MNFLNQVDMAYYEEILAYIGEMSPRVFKEAGGRFSHPFIDPGSETYDGNLWDWDTFWTVYALMGFSKTKTAPPGFNEKLTRFAKGNVLNFLEFQLDDGYIPMLVSKDIQEDGEEDYLIRKHKEGVILNMHKPFLCQQALIISEFCDSYDWIFSHVEQLELYFECYEKYYYNENCGLYVWADDVMIGMDNDPAVFGRPRFSTASMYLNGFMISELDAMQQLLLTFDQSEKADIYAEKSKALQKAIQAECYDGRDQFFYSVDVDIKTRSYDWFHEGLGVFWKTLPIKIRTWTGFIPLFSNIATKEQAKAVVNLHIEDPRTFACDYGVRTLARDEKMYNLEATNNPSNWLGPIWMVANYVTFRGLLNYGYEKEAADICKKTLRLLGEDLRTSGHLHEYYVPETGHPVMTPGFLNWNMLAVNMVGEISGQEAVFDYLKKSEK